MSEMTLEDVIAPRDWFEAELHARPLIEAANNMAYAVKMQWQDPSGFRDQQVAIMSSICVTAGLTENEICNIIHRVRKEAPDGTYQKHQA